MEGDRGERIQSNLQHGAIKGQRFVTQGNLCMTLRMPPLLQNEDTHQIDAGTDVALAWQASQLTPLHTEKLVHVTGEQHWGGWQQGFMAHWWVEGVWKTSTMCGPGGPFGVRSLLVLTQLYLQSLFHRRVARTV